MAMNREQKRAMQRAGQLNPDGSQATATRDRRAPAQKLKSERARPAEFIREVRAELKKVSWPTRQEVLRYSVIVLVALVVFTVLVFVLDFLFGEFANFLFDTTPDSSSALGAIAHHIATF